MLKRRRSLIKSAEDVGCDTLLACTPENVFYMTGFWGEGMVVLNGDGVTIVAPGLEAPRAESEGMDCNIIPTERGADMIPQVAELLEGCLTCTDCVHYPTMMLLQKHIPDVRYAPDPFYKCRTRKDDGEIRILEDASHRIDEMFWFCADTMAAGQTESELQAVLMSNAMRYGMFDTGYPTTLNPLIVAGGPNGALPHAQVTDRKFQRGDLVVVDITLRYKGYVSDATRTFGIGDISAENIRIYETVREAQELGLEAATVGVRCSDVDKACRDYIKSRGYGEFFIHSTGHGVGLEVHEQPTISKGAKDILLKDMAVTIEPGIYVPGKVGVRVEDSIIVGRASMHKYTKDLVVI